MKNDKKTQKVRIKNVLLRFLDNFQLDGTETVGDIVKGVNDAYDFVGNRVMSDRDLLEICFLMIRRRIDPLAREYIDSLKRAWAQDPEIKTLPELERKHFGYVNTTKSSPENESPKSSVGLGIITLDPMREMLGPGYIYFASPFGVEGVARESANRVDFVLIIFNMKDRENFRAFIYHCQTSYHTCCVWGAWKPAIVGPLRRQEFRAAQETDQFNRVFRGWRWDRLKPLWHPLIGVGPLEQPLAQLIPR